MNYLKISLGILLVLSASRFIPHPPNFTSLMALSFYVPAILGIKFLPALILSFILTDLIIGLHFTVLFTWGSVIIIGLLSTYFCKTILFRFSGAIGGAIIFYLLSNFGVWSGGSYGYDFQGLMMCFYLALPFFGNTLLSTILFSALIELVLKYYKSDYFKNFQISK